MNLSFYLNTCMSIVYDLLQNTLTWSDFKFKWTIFLPSFLALKDQVFVFTAAFILLYSIFEQTKVILTDKFWHPWWFSCCLLIIWFAHYCSGSGSNNFFFCKYNEHSILLKLHLVVHTWYVSVYKYVHDFAFKHTFHIHIYYTFCKDHIHL